MRTLILVNSFFILFLNVTGQNLENLDNKMGFNKFKLESSYDKYKANLKLTIKETNGVNFYDYVGGDIKSVFGVLVKQINLAFYKGKLYSISIEFDYTSEEEDLVLQRHLKELFGITAILKNIKTSSGALLDWVMQWDSKKVLLQIQKYNLLSSTYPGWSTEIFLYSKKIKSEINNDSF